MASHARELVSEGAILALPFRTLYGMHLSALSGEQGGHDRHRLDSASDEPGKARWRSRRMRDSS